MNKAELERLRKRIERLQQQDKGVIIQLTDGLFKYKNYTLSKLDSSDEIDETFDTDSRHLMIYMDGTEVNYIRILNVTQALEDGGLDGWF